MIVQLLLLAGCQPIDSVATLTDDTEKPVAEALVSRVVPEPESTASERVRLPSGGPIVRECYGGSQERSRANAPAKSTPTGGVGLRSGSGGGYGAAAGAPPPAAPVASATPPASASAPVARSSARAAADDASDASGASRRGRAGDKKSARPEAQVAQSATPAQAEWESRLRALGYGGGGEGLLGVTAGDSATKGSGKDKAAGAATPDRDLAEAKTEEISMVDEPLARGPSVDWGATTYLSNDDSMSLASAQRLLWAVQNRGPVQASQIRPHEFLNYFSFETADVKAGDTFSVRAAAEETSPGTLSMAFAVKGATPAHRPTDLTMVLDRSGSMSAEGRMEYLKRGLHVMEKQLQRGDRLDLVLFDDQVCTPLENFVVGRDDPSLLTEAIDDLQPRGSTNLDLGLREGYRIANGRTDADARNRRVLLISDALLNTGDVNHDTVSEVAKAYEKADVRLTAVGVGREFNDKVLDMLSEKGKGAYVYLGSEAVVDRIFGPMFGALTQTIAHDVRFALDLPPSLAMERFYGEEASTVKEDVQPIHYFAGTTQLFLQDLKMRGNSPVYDDPVKLTVEWIDAKTGAPRTQVFASTVGQLVSADARNLRKGRALMAWTDLLLERSLGGNACGAPYATWEERVGALGDDAEIAWLDGLTAPLCGRQVASARRPAPAGVPYKVKVDSDTVIAEVGMECSGDRDLAALSGNVARFEVRPGACNLVLYGPVPLVARVDVPSTGGDIRCVVRGGRLSCG